MAGHIPVETDPKEVERAQNLWASFTVLLKYSTFVTIGILAILGLVFVDW